MTMHGSIAAVAIGRNEGDRLTACLTSLRAAGIARIVYVDSGSVDASVKNAERQGAEVVRLDMSQPFTAARARNAGLATFHDHPPEFVQFIDGDCRLDPDWPSKAKVFLQENPEVAVVCGRRRETDPAASIYNRLCDAEWDTPVGFAQACGGDALIRWRALEAVGGYDPRLIAGEEPEMCYRMRQAGWQIYRLDAEMTLHDAAMTRFSQFWNRTRRAGFTFAEGAAMYGRTAERYNVAALSRAVLWGMLLPIGIVLMTVFLGPVALLLVLVYLLQLLRLVRRFGWERGVFFTIGKFAEAQGALEYIWRRLLRRDARLIEYK